MGSSDELKGFGREKERDGVGKGRDDVGNAETEGVEV